MSFLDRIKLSLNGVTSNKFRTFLTLLGIIIGVGAVILMISLGSGTQSVVTGEFESVVSKQVLIAPNNNLAYTQRGRLTEDDGEYLKEMAVGVENVYPFKQSYEQIEFKDESTNNNITSVMHEALDCTNLKPEHGRTLTEYDIKNHNKVVVLGYMAADSLVDGKDFSQLVNEKIMLGGEKFLVVGVFGMASTSIILGNNTIAIPYTTYKDIWRRNTEQVDYYMAVYDENSSESDIVNQMKYLLNNKYGKYGGKSRFQLIGIQGQLDIINKVFQVLTYLLAGIAAISLIVGGIGVMNIMLVSVKERTREIGVRMAIGASRIDVRGQFLIESIILSLSGGLIGILAGSGLSALLNLGLGQIYEWWQGSIPLWSILISFGVTVVIGIVFGFYPAYKASKLDPIEALRYE